MMGHMSESTQRAVIKKLMPFKSRIEELIDAGTVFLMTGNACEVFCRHISYVTEKTETDALGIFPLDARCDLGVSIKSASGMHSRRYTLF